MGELTERYPNLFLTLGTTTAFVEGVREILVEKRDAGETGNEVAMVNVADAFGIELADLAWELFTEALGLVGITMPHVSALAFALGGAITAIGGALISTFITLDASVGVVFTLKALIFVIMGGVGEVREAIVAAIIPGVVETAVATLIDPGLTRAAAYPILVLVLLFRPQSLFGRRAL